jgi:hypothetical protein
MRILLHLWATANDGDQAKLQNGRWPLQRTAGSGSQWVAAQTTSWSQSTATPLVS